MGANELPQDAATIFCAKSPVVMMPLIVKVAVPLLVRVTARAAAVVPTFTAPQAREAGLMVTAAAPVVSGFTVKPSVVGLVNAPEVPWMVAVTVPVVAVALALKVRVLVVVAAEGLNDAVTPLGKPDADRVTLPVKPFTGVTVTALVAVLPWVSDKLLGEADNVKLGVAPAPAKASINPVPFGLPKPVAKS